MASAHEKGAFVMYFGFKNITVGYGKAPVLREFTLDVPKSKILTVIGENGSGKSTLLKTVFGTLTPSVGNVILEDKPIGGYSPKALAQKIAYLPQSHTVPDDMDVYTLVSLGRYPYRKLARGLTKSDTDAVERAIELTGLSALQDRAVASLSGGEAQRAWIAMAIAQEADILILDEPTTYLDIGYQVEVLELIKKLSSELGLTVLCVLHDINMAARYSDIICAIKDGSVCVCGTPDEVVTRENLARIFGINADVLYDTAHGCPYFIARERLGGERQ